MKTEKICIDLDISKLKVRNYEIRGRLFLCLATKIINHVYIQTYKWFCFVPGLRIDHEITVYK